MNVIEQLRVWSARNVLDLYVDGRLTEAAAARVAACLERHPELKREADALRPVRVAARSGPEMPNDLAASILAKYQDQPREEEVEAPSIPDLEWTPAQSIAAHTIGSSRTPSRAGSDGSGVKTAATEVSPRGPGKIARPSSRSGPHEKHVGKA